MVLAWTIIVPQESGLLANSSRDLHPVKFRRCIWYCDGRLWSLLDSTVRIRLATLSHILLFLLPVHLISRPLLLRSPVPIYPRARTTRRPIRRASSQRAYHVWMPSVALGNLSARKGRPLLRMRRWTDEHEGSKDHGHQQDTVCVDFHDFPPSTIVIMITPISDRCD